MLGLPSAPSPCPPSMLPIMLPRPASLNMPCMLLGPIRPPISPPIIRGMPELPGTSLMISKPGSSPALVLRSLERNRRSGGAQPKQSHFCRVANGFFSMLILGCFDSSAQKNLEQTSFQFYPRLLIFLPTSSSLSLSTKGFFLRCLDSIH